MKEPTQPPRPIPQGPTNNSDYNRAYALWLEVPECGTQVECEECGEDLTGKDVHERPAGWLCDCCKDKYDNNPQVFQEEQHADTGT